MTYEQGVRIATRVITFYFIFWVVTDITAIPGELVTLRHEWQQATFLRPYTPGEMETTGRYLLRIAFVNLAANLLRIGLWLWAARWFYNITPEVQRFFGIEGKAPTHESEP